VDGPVAEGAVTRKGVLSYEVPAVQGKLTGRIVEGEGSMDASNGIESQLGNSQPAGHCACITPECFVVDILILISVFGLPLSLANLGSVEEKLAF